ncbi:MAG: amidase family protein [Myxococcota bacterium]
MVRRREITISALVEAHIQRIEALNPWLNAVVAERFEAARAEAEHAEQILARVRPDALPPFFGVPCTIKELIAVRGMPHTAGVVARQGMVAEEDAPQVARIRAAGAIILGVTNVSEAGLWLETSNRIYGRTSNAYAIDRISGGSTGGEAAIIGAGGSPFGLGADIGGSIRNPCFFNGIYGHKPSGGLLPATGHWPEAGPRRGRYCVTGPMGRSVKDLETLMEAVSLNVDPHRDLGRPPFERRRDLTPAEVTVHWFVDNGIADPSEELSRNIEDTVLLLEDLGFRTARFRPEKMPRAAEIWGAIISTSAEETVRDLLGNGHPIDLWRQWLRLPLGRSDHSFISLAMATLEGLAHLTPGRTERLIAMGKAMRGEIEAQLGPRGVLLCPPYPRAAPRHHEPLLSPFSFSYCGIFNALELPATALPTGFTDDGLPLGVQIVGRRFDDALTLWVAGALEAALPPWRPGPRKRYRLVS